MCLLHKFLKLFVNRHIFFQITRISRKDFFAIIIIIIIVDKPVTAPSSLPPQHLIRLPQLFGKFANRLQSQFIQLMQSLRRSRRVGGQRANAGFAVARHVLLGCVEINGVWWRRRRRWLMLMLMLMLRIVLLLRRMIRRRVMADLLRLLLLLLLLRRSSRLSPQQQPPLTATTVL